MLYRMREKMAYSNIGKFMLAKILKSDCRLRWLQQAVADGSLRRIRDYSAI